ncbi:response regulator, partial [uncultured Eubacterium sp.]
MIKTIIVDDEPMVAEIIRYFVKKGDLPLDIVGTADNGIIAEELIRKYQPDLVFLDIQMPMKNGFEVMRDQPDTKYIIVTAFDTFDYAQRALRLGAMDILLKPIDYEQLKQSVSRVVGWNFTANDTVNDIVEYINHHYAEDISLTDLSEQFFLTSSHIARLFKKYMGE